ncbi:N-acyl-D-amino-acid deacylase family protein [Sphingobium sp. TKS]|uniref:N-acyl-D-amino-acid deacylase family protein n=1 Tax=Sphingobium sp. TKS TaxID=1315974 RepID=UPI0007702D1B|nr:amidohydrolase family protein [Sphingobium sp. TKS]AMK25583.1 D-aminoacylase domain-containing protein [Sphingobium sp. TKS]
MTVEYDTIIRGGTIVDGTGMPKWVGDLAIKEGKIAAIDGLKKAKAKKEINAEGLIVAPGFVDAHTHYDAQLFWDPYCTISGWHGVTSVVIGNCGFGFAPCRPEDRDRSMLSMTRNEQIALEAMQEGMPWDWTTFPEFLDSLDRTPKGVNVLTFAPLSPLMIYAMGSFAEAKKRRPNEEELKKICDLIDDAMEAGAAGWSVQRMGEHSIQPDFDGTPMVTDIMTDEEGYAFAEVLRKRGEGIIQLTYAPSGDKMAEDFFDLPTVEGWVEKLAEVSGRPVLHNTLLAIDGKPEVHRHAMEWLQACHEKGLTVYGHADTNRNFQQFNFETWNGFDIAPNWKAALMGTSEERLANLKNPEIRAKMIADKPWLASFEGIGLIVDEIEVLDGAGYPEVEKYVGKNLGQIAAEEGKDNLEVMIEIAVASELKATLRTPIVHRPNAEYIAELMKSGKALPGISDGGAHMKYFVGGAYSTDFLTWMVRDTGLLTLEEAHFLLSALPARVNGFKDRGTLTEGQAADIIIYDMDVLKQVPEGLFETRQDLPGGDWRRVRWAEGYRWTIVNGDVTFENGVCTNATPGKLLRHGRA